MTTDFFTPVVDEAYDYGAIAVANSLSDVYAMGGKPFLGLNIAAFPPDLPIELMTEILRGGADKAKEAQVVIAGGHTIQDKEPKYGLVALGMVNPSQMITKKGALPGDKLVLTKPLGFGVTTTALKQGRAEPQYVDEAVKWMKSLNKAAAELANEFELRAGTDITGFGLLGHAWEMADLSSAGLRFSFSALPFVSGARHFAEQWIFPGGSFDNRAYFSPHVRFAPQVDEPSQMLLYDAQTSGGLLLAVPSQKLDGFLRRATQSGIEVWLVGEVMAGRGIVVEA